MSVKLKYLAAAALRLRVAPLCPPPPSNIVVCEPSLPMKLNPTSPCAAAAAAGGVFVVVVVAVEGRCASERARRYSRSKPRLPKQRGRPLPVHDPLTARVLHEPSPARPSMASSTMPA